MNAISRKQLESLIALEVANLSEHAAAELAHWLTGRPIRFEPAEAHFLTDKDAPPTPMQLRLPILKSVA